MDFLAALTQQTRSTDLEAEVHTTTVMSDDAQPNLLRAFGDEYAQPQLPPSLHRLFVF